MPTVTATTAALLEAANNAASASALTTMLQGAEADPTKIGAEYFPDLIQVDGVALSDTSAVEEPANTLGLNSHGRLVIHDGDTTGGVDAEGMILRGFLSHTVADSIAADQILEIASAVIPASAFINGQYIAITGNVVISASGLSGYNPVGNPSLVIYLCDATGARNSLAEPEDGYRLTIASAAAPAEHTIVEVREMWTAGVASSLLSLNVSSVTGATRMRTLAAGTATETEKVWTANGLSNERSVAYGGTGGFAYVKIGIFLPADAATADAVGTINVYCDIKILRV